MSFWRPTKVTWIVFSLLVVFNVVAPIVAAWPNEKIIFPRLEYFVFIIPLYQVLGLSDLFLNLGFDVFTHDTFIPAPNAFGWLLVGCSILFFLFIHYVLASLVSYAIYRRRVE